MRNDNLAHKNEFREETIDGKLIAMSPATSNHNRIAGNIFGIFWSYLRGKKCVPYGEHGAPDLVVEILSPSTAKNDKGHKKEVYAKYGVREYWIVSPAEKSVEVYHNTGNAFLLQNVYTARSQWLLARLSESEQAAMITHFKCSLYNDLEISLDDIFYDLLP